MMKKTSAIIVPVLLIVMLSFQVVGFGISPADKTVQFTSGENVPLEFSILNSESNDIDIQLSAVGDLKDAVFFEKEIIHLSPETYRNTFKAFVQLPENLTPGTHVIFLKFTPLFKSGDDSFKAYISPEVPIKIRVPYPSKYAEVNLVVFPAVEGNPVPMSLEFDNLGDEDIQAAGGTIRVYDSDDTLMNTLIVPEISIAQNTFGKSEAQPIIGLRNGEYKAEVSAYYDSIKIELEQNISSGEPDVNVIKFATKKIVAGQVNQVEFTPKLDWNVPLQAKAFLIVDGHETEMPDFTLRPDDELQVRGFFDATSVGAGMKNITVRFIFGSKIQDYSFPIEVLPAGSILGVDKSKVSGWLVIALAVAIIALLVWFFFRKKPKALTPLVQKTVEQEVKEEKQLELPKEFFSKKDEPAEPQPNVEEAKLVEPKPVVKPVDESAFVDQHPAHADEPFSEDKSSETFK